MIPPPHAVRNAIMIMPNKSNSLSLAASAPEIAKTKVPRRSRIENNSSVLMELISFLRLVRVLPDVDVPRRHPVV